jgi:arsenate reductase (thioredoxin)
MRQILFVCVENSNRSQMAEAFAKVLGAGRVEAYSAGSRPSGAVNPMAIAAMREKGYDLSSHRSKHISDVPQGPYDYVVTMGCGDSCPFIPAAHREDWAIADPKGLTQDGYNQVRDEIERQVRALLAVLRPDGESPVSVRHEPAAGAS